MRFLLRQSSLFLFTLLNNNCSEVNKMNYLFHYLRKRPGAVGIVIVLTIITSALRVTHALINVNIFNALIKL